MRILRDRPGSVELDEFLARPLFAHLATSSDLGPRDSPVWFLWEEAAIWIIGSRTDDSFPRRVELEGRCAIGIVDFNHATGLVQHVGLRGVAAVERFDAGRARRLLRRYLGGEEDLWDERFRRTVAARAEEVLIRFEPMTVERAPVS